MDQDPGVHSRRHKAEFGPMARAGLWALALVLALGVFMAYLDPALMVTLGNTLWSCF